MKDTLPNDAGIKTPTLIIATLSSFAMPFMGSAINLALPSIGKEFQIDAVLLSWVATSYLLAAAISLVPCGRLADIYGRKKIFTYGISAFTITSFLCAISTSTPMLILFRIFQGAASSMIFATGIAILTSVFPPQERGKALGINVAAVYIGLSLGPFLGGLLTQHLTWRSVFLLNVSIDRTPALSLRLRRFAGRAARWHVPEGSTAEIPLTETGDDLVAQLPPLGPWSVGFLACDDKRR